MTTYRHPCKCLDCGLHFAVFSWYEDWPQGGSAPFCPECGNNTRIMPFGPEIMDGQIYEYVGARFADPRDLHT